MIEHEARPSAGDLELVRPAWARTMLLIVDNGWTRMRAEVLGLGLLVVACMGADCFPASSSDGGYVGFGTPSIELTVDGTHVGPYAADATSFADLVTSRNALGQVLASDLTIHAAGGLASCDLHISRFGVGVAPIATGPYRLMAATGAGTPDGTASPVGGVIAKAGRLTLACNGSDCNTAVLANTVIDARHLEGYVTATMYDYADGQPSNIVCSYYVPWRTYSP